MDVELVEIGEFLKARHPFDLLPDDEMTTLPAKLELSYARKDTVVLEPGRPCPYLYIVRTGAAETRSPDGQLLARLGEGDAFGIHALLNNATAVNRVTAIEDSLFYMLPRSEFERLRGQFRQFAYFFAPLGAERLSEAQGHVQDRMGEDGQLSLMSCRAGDLLTREPVTIAKDRTIQDAALTMLENRVSCLLVTDSDGGELVGIITDRDLRNRVVAAAVDVQTPVGNLMTRNPITLDASAYAFDALLTMTRKNIRHLPVKRGERIAGVITNTNLVQIQTSSAVYLVGDVYKRETREELAQVVGRAAQTLVHLVDAGATAQNISHVMTSIADAATARLLQLAEDRLGLPPVPYLWLAGGSQARQEMSGRSTQDNCLVLDDVFDGADHGEYFEELARFVCDGLAACGYALDAGGAVAANRRWRKPLADWIADFTGWIDRPDAATLAEVANLFDMRPIRGETLLCAELSALIRDKARGNAPFLGRMTANALEHAPPLGFFRNFVLISGGEHDHSFDMKYSGVAPIVEIGRIAALGAGAEALNTVERLGVARDAGVLATDEARDLIDAFEFIALARLRHQARLIRAGKVPDDFMPPDDLSHFERNHLREAFAVVKATQGRLSSVYGKG